MHKSPSSRLEIATGILNYRYYLTFFGIKAPCASKQLPVIITAVAPILPAMSSWLWILGRSKQVATCCK